MMKKNVVLCVLCCLLLCAACAAPTESTADKNAYYTFTDSTGVAVTLHNKPQNCAVLFSSFAEIWTLAGGEIAVTVGETVERGFAEQGTLLADLGAGKSVDTEMLLTSQVDFVIASADIPAQVQVVSFLRKQGIACALFSVESFADYLTVLQVCTDILENPSAYETYGTNVREQTEDLLAENTGEPQDILFIRSGSSASSAKAKTAQTHFAAAMLKELGTRNIAEEAGILTETLSAEEILLRDPDRIFICTMGDETAARSYMQTVLQTDAWQQLTAVAKGRVYFLPKDLFQYKPNHRWADAYAYLLHCLQA
ncbi:MAG: ABC transporter substrate-binding protein [Clostridia bacterium]|nr:ABC transporter substrate-binding protein [Clostridia bacterium]